MGRIVAFGCSHTYGMGLDDCFNENNYFLVNAEPSNYAWPSLLAKKLNFDIINKSICAGSNLEILNEILNFSFEPGDKVVVGWTNPERDLLFFHDGNIRIASFLVDGKFNQKELESIIPNLFSKNKQDDVKRLNSIYFQTHSSEDMNYRSWIYQYTAGLHLKSKNIEFYFASMWNWNLQRINIDNFLNQINYSDFLHSKNLLDYANDKMHIGPIAHRTISEDVFKAVSDPILGWAL